MSSEITPVSCDTEQTEISASATSDVLPEYECDHLWLTKAGSEYRFKFVEWCAKCGVEL